MTVNELIEKLKAYPSDLRVLFAADMGHIEATDPTIEFEPETEHGYPATLYIDLDS
jgi:hypothetical protein